MRRRYDRALTWLEPLKDAAYPSAMLHENLGEAYEGLDQIQNAIEAYTCARDDNLDEETLVRSARPFPWPGTGVVPSLAKKPPA